MISRRSLLAWLGIAPFAIAATDLSAVARPAVQSVGVIPRARGWKMALNADGSSDFVKDGKGWLEAWVQDKKKGPVQDELVFPTRWNDCVEHPDGTSILEIIEENIKISADRIKERSNPWAELEQFEAETGVKAPVEYKIYDSGTYFPQDMGGDPEENVRRWKSEGLSEKYGDIQEPWIRSGSRSKYDLDAVVRMSHRPLEPGSNGFHQIIEEYTAPDGRFLATAEF